jgi:hypothetical protein
MKEILRQMFTETDNETHDGGKWAAALMTLTGLGLQIYAVVGNKQAFDMQAFGVGCGALAAGVGAMLKLKPEAKKE